MSCTCDYGEAATIWREEERRARREHRCSDCGGMIRRGEHYRSLACLFDGEWSCSKRCADCQFLIHEVERAFMGACGGTWCGIYLGDLPESWSEIVDSMWSGPEVEEARRIVAMQRVACEARGGKRKWCLPPRIQMDEDDAHG
jgi:hypothetical protein